MVDMQQMTEGSGCREVFDSEWKTALRTGDDRRLIYPADPPHTQVELFELVKANQIDSIFEQHKIHTGRILEYACGAAGMSAYFANKGFDVVPLDISWSALQLVELNCARHCVPPARYSRVLADVYALPFDNCTFDAVMSFGLLEHFTWEQLVPLLREIHRVLRPGGLHVVDIIHGRFSIRTIATWVNFAASAAIRCTTGRINEISALFHAYFANYYENTLDPSAYAQLFETTGLINVQVQTCRPFPMLALKGPADRFYTDMLQMMLPGWRTYDRTRMPLIDWLGWMYLAHGVKG